MARKNGWVGCGIEPWHSGFMTRQVKTLPRSLTTRMNENRSGIDENKVRINEDEGNKETEKT